MRSAEAETACICGARCRMPRMGAMRDGWRRSDSGSDDELTPKAGLPGSGLDQAGGLGNNIEDDLGSGGRGRLEASAMLLLEVDFAGWLDWGIFSRLVSFASRCGGASCLAMRCWGRCSHIFAVQSAVLAAGYGAGQVAGKFVGKIGYWLAQDVRRTLFPLSPLATAAKGVWAQDRLCVGRLTGED